MQEDIYDVTIIGGGPAGLFSAFYSGLRAMKTKIIEFQPQLGGKVHVYPEKLIWDIGGLTPTSGAQLIQQLTEQGQTFQPTVVLNEKVLTIAKNEQQHFVLTCSSGKQHLSKTVILAIGSGILKPQKLTLEGAEKYEVSNLHYTVKSLQQFKNKTVIISGGGNSAIDWAIELLPYAKQVYLTYRKDALKGHEAQVVQLHNSSARCFLNSSITKLIANKQHNHIQSVQLTDELTGDTIRLAVDEVIINHGYERDHSLLDNCDFTIDMQDEYCVKCSPHGETSINGLFAAGDIMSNTGKIHLIAGAFQDAVNAVNQAKQYIDPEAENSAMVSSHNVMFREKNKEIAKTLSI